MARKRKELPVIHNITITDVAAEGKSISRTDNEMVLFVPFGAPGDVVDVKIDRKRKNYAEGHIVSMIKPSDLRVAPRCEHFTVCGGCKWQHLPYEMQLQFKQRQVSDALTRIGKIDLPQISDILGSEQIWAYRNKMEYTFSNKKWLTFEQLNSGETFDNRNCAGFHIPGAFDKVLDINQCHLQDPIGDDIRLFIKKFGLENGYTFYDLKNQSGLLRTLMIRLSLTGEIMVVMVFGEDDSDRITALMQAIADRFPQITSLMYVVNTKLNDTISDQDVVLFSGNDHIMEAMEDLKFRVGPKSFYQTNSKQALRLYSVARDFADLHGSELVYDLYTGTGTIANFVARNAAKVIGIEYVPEAIEDAKVNSMINGIDNTDFYAGDMKDVLNDDFIAAHGCPDVMIVDPPRAGMHEDVVNVILNAAPQRIVYVSCNPATQARDLALLDSKYKVVAVQPVDMFPHTHHVENVAKLIRR